MQGLLMSKNHWKDLGVAFGRAFHSYCTGLSHGPVSVAIPNAKN